MKYALVNSQWGHRAAHRHKRDKEHQRDRDDMRRGDVEQPSTLAPRTFRLVDVFPRLVTAQHVVHLFALERYFLLDLVTDLEEVGTGLAEEAHAVGLARAQDIGTRTGQRESEAMQRDKERERDEERSREASRRTHVRLDEQNVPAAWAEVHDGAVAGE